MDMKQFVVLSDKNPNSGLGPVDYKNVKGYLCGDSADLEEARMLVGALRNSPPQKDARILIVDALTYDGKAVKVLFDSAAK